MSIAIKQFCKFISIILVISLFLVLPTASILAQDYEIDMGVSREGIWFSPTQFFAGDSVKIYARIENYGSEDITGQVTFFQGVNQIGKPKSVSIVSGGQAEEIWTNEWIAPEGRVNIKVAVVDAEPMDENWDNNEAISTTFDVQKDTDGDNIGDDEDLDDDGDVMPDAWEEEHNFDPLDSTDAQEDADSDSMINVDEYNSGTDPHNADTDGDGVIDGDDAFPLDSSETIDTDGDGIGNNSDNDDDGDGISDAQDEYPLDSSRSIPPPVEPIANNLPVDSEDDSDEIGNPEPFNNDSVELVDTVEQGDVVDVDTETTIEDTKDNDEEAVELAINTIDEVDESTSFLADDDYEMDIKKIVIFGLAGLIAFVLLGLFIKELVRK